LTDDVLRVVRSCGVTPCLKMKLVRDVGGGLLLDITPPARDPGSKREAQLDPVVPESGPDSRRTEFMDMGQ
jgi:hypothetical protein